MRKEQESEELVSVVIPVYNDSEVLPRALKSALQQSLDNIRIYVVDDSSPDEVNDAISHFNDSRIRVISHENNQGGAAARNTGISASSGRYIAFLDADDAWYPSKLDNQVTALEESDSSVCSYCGFERDGGSLLSVLKESLFEKIFPVDEFSLGGKLKVELLKQDAHIGGSSSLLVKREVVEQIGGFDERFPRHQDLEFLIRVLDHGDIEYVDKTLVTKFGSGEPQPATLRKAKILFLSKFNKEIAELEERGEEVYENHYYHLSRSYMKDARLREGFGYMILGSPSNFSKILLSLWAFVSGIARKVRDIF